MTTSTAPARPLAREVDGRLVAGVAAGLHRMTGLPVVALRLALVVLCAAHGLGAAVYAVFWVFLPQSEGRRPAATSQHPWVRAAVLMLAGIGVGIALVTHVLPGASTTGPLLAVAAGVVLVWQQADESRRARWRASASGGRARAVRLGLGALLLVVGLVGYLASRGQLAVARAGLLSTVVIVAGLILLSSPWWFAMATDLRDERRERIRSQERAEVAAHLHDSVLQTLALIQKSSGSAAEVTRLARRQERELRSWLYATTPSEATLLGALQAATADVEEAHGVPVELVCVGPADTLPLDERLQALVAATREAMVNSAKHSGAAAVDVYAEVEPQLASVFVRDRGTGFDPRQVPDDRHGLSGSIVGRMARHGGTAEVRSAPGDGTEIRLGLPVA